ncbi:hypothetical protein [Okeania sp. SIO2B3]|uniref:hypothetical protein n=1 Tax=Okeania sp. SIO2B3 TaxID=2607784 RepID=UPI0013C13858|nr:hypothetical protein [Okeania sp. SIO2B3]NET42553.1 hypothetical protein [Okeania sp. SIO2B3]
MKFNDLASLKQLFVETISVNSVAEFEDLIEEDSLWRDGECGKGSMVNLEANFHFFPY